MQISDACYEVANEILEPLGVSLEPETVTQILLDGQAVGSQILNDPTPELQAISEQIFGDDTSSLPSGGRSADFFNRFLVVFEAEYARGNNAAYSYQVVCNELGVPIPGTDLDSVLDVLVASDEYWSEQHPEEWGGANKWWSFKRIIAVAATDGVSGILAAAGYGSIGGPGGCAAGATVGGVVGVLSSIGVNDMVFN